MPAASLQEVSLYFPRPSFPPLYSVQNGGEKPHQILSLRARGKGGETKCLGFQDTLHINRFPPLTYTKTGKREEEEENEKVGNICLPLRSL